MAKLGKEILREIDKQVVELRDLRCSLEKTLYETDWELDTDADPLLDKIEAVNKQINKLRKKRSQIYTQLNPPEVKEVGAGCHFSNLSLKSLAASSSY